MSAHKQVLIVLVMGTLLPGLAAASPQRVARRLVAWPAGGAPASFEALEQALRGELRRHMRFRRAHPDRDVVWRGPALPKWLAATSPPVSERWRAARLRKVERDQGRDTLTEVLSPLINLGMEQGRRLAITSTRLARVTDHLREAQRLLGAGGLSQVRGALKRALDAMPQRASDIRGGRRRVVSLIGRRGGRAWPAGPAPIRASELIDPISTALRQAYRVSAIDRGRPVESALRDGLDVGLHLGIEQGKRAFLGREIAPLRAQLELAVLLADSEAARPLLTQTVSGLVDALNWVGE